MVHGRIEMSSAEQLVELRKARDRYKALADRFREEGDALTGRFESQGDPIIVMQEKLKHERDARRIANAYEKSIANIETRCSLMRQAHTATPRLQSVGTRPAMLAFFLIVAGIGISIIAYPRLYRQALASLPVVQDYFVPMRPIVTLDALSRPSAPAPQRPATEIRPTAKTKPHGAIAPRAAASVVPAKRQSIRKAHHALRISNPVAPHEGDFTVKVLQPDGTLKEQKFTARPQR